MANEQNLKPIQKGEMSKEEAKKRGSIGGKASVRKRRERKLLKETILEILKEPIQKGSKTTRQEAIMTNVLARLFKEGDIKDVKVLAEILGELKVADVSQGVTINISSSDEGKTEIDKLMNGDN